MSNLVKHRAGTIARVDEGPGTALAPRPDGSLVPPGPPTVSMTPVPAKPKGPTRLAIAVIAAAIVAAVAVGAAAFSGGSAASGSGADIASTSPSGAAHGSLAASAAASASASSVSFTVSATETTPSSTTTLLQGNGSADLAKGVGRLTASVPGLSSVLGVGSQSSVDVISDGTNVYLNIPGVSTLTGGKSWVETSLAGLGSLTGSSASSLSLSTLANPSEAFHTLGSLGSPVTDEGTVTLNGEQVTEYQATVNIADVASRLAQGSDASGAAAKAIQKLGIPTVPVTAWVGHDGLLRQLSLTADVSHASLGGLLGALGSGSSTAAAGTTVSVILGLSHYGDPVSVSVPPASDVTNLNDIASSLKGVAAQLGGALSGIASHV